MAHDHSHGHDHGNGDRNAYYLNQLFTIAVCGALGGVAVMDWYSGTIKLMLHPKFFPWVLSGGITLLVLVVLRAVAVWRSVDKLAAVPEHMHDHDHCGEDHGHCDHEHDHDHDHEHGHDHGHDHGWAPWRYVVLLLPVVLYLLNLPNQGFSADAGGSDLSALALSAPDAVGGSGGRVNVGFVELQQASLTPESRDFYEGKTVTLTGQYRGRDAKRFTLVRFKIACCAADAVPLNAIIMVSDKSGDKVDPDDYRAKWVRVTGRIHFFQKPGSEEFITGLILYPTKEEPISKLVEIIAPPSSPWVN